MTFQELATCLIAVATFGWAIQEALQRPTPASIIIAICGLIFGIGSGWGYWLIMKRIQPRSSWWLLLGISWLISSLFAVTLLAQHV